MVQNNNGDDKEKYRIVSLQESRETVKPGTVHPGRRF
jgi:hypothetical protein